MNKLSDKNPCDTCTVDRQIGNPYRWQCECDRCQKPYEWKKECVNRLSEYESIGTVEECRVAVERQMVKKPIEVKQSLIRYTDGYICPSCGGGFTGNDKPYFIAKCQVGIGKGNEEWGAEKGKEYFLLIIKEIVKGSGNHAERID